MGVYRSDQAQLTFASEAAQGGDPEMHEGDLVGSGATASINNSDGEPAGSRKITVDGVSNTFTIGDFIRIGTVAGTALNSIVEHEVRRIEAMDNAGGTSSNVFTLDRPTAFFHGDNEEVKEVSGIGATDSGSNLSNQVIRNDKSKYITFIPGVYETVDTPDPEMTIEGRRFLSTQSKRNFSVAYPGQQTLSGSLSDFILLNGWALRFPIGTVTTTPSATATDTILLNQADTVAASCKKGDIYITCDGGDVANLSAGDYIQIVEADGTKSEVRRIVVDTSDTFRLDYPLQYDHANNAVINEVSAGATYTHVIEEATDLDTMTWHLHMRESTETVAKDFDRRYVGGMVDSATISADEGGMLMMSWDTVNFLNMAHNQRNQTTVSTNDYNSASVAANLPRFSLMQSIDTDDVNNGAQTVADANDGSGFPNTQPYYFSEGTIKFFGQEFARIRNFSLSINNNVESRYYVGKQGARARGPFEHHEGARDYSMSATVTLPDASLDADTVHGSAVRTNATELFKQLLLEGDYGGTTAATARAGFTMSLRFDRGTSDYIIIDVPTSGTGTADDGTSSTAGKPTVGSNAVNSQGVFINSAQHGVTGENPLQVDLNMIFRSLKITIVDSVPVYP